jgi:tetratricopeptide (TPR) repeat protein
MISLDQSPTFVLQSMEDRVDILFRELELAVKWQRPSILLAIYNSDSLHADAETRLKKNLQGLGQLIHGLEVKNTEILNLAEMVPANADLHKTIFFVDGFDWGSLKDSGIDNSVFDQFRDFFIENRIRVVFWLRDNDANNLAHYAPDFWTFRHCSVEFIGSAEECPSSRIELALDTHNISFLDGEDEKDGNDEGNVSIIDPPDDNQSEVTHLNLSLTLGILSWRKGDYPKAMEFLQSALEIAGTIKDHWFKALCFNSIALVQTSMGKPDEAIRSYESALEITPENVFPWSNLGNLYFKSDLNEKAMGAFQKAVDLDAKDAISWNGLGDVYTKLGKMDEAIAAFQKAIELAPNFAHPWNGLGNIYAGQGQTDTAINAYQKTIELNGNIINPWICLGNIFKKQNRIGDALSAFQKAIEIDPRNARIWNEMGSLHFINGDHVHAMDAYKKAMEFDPGFGMAYCNLAFTYTHQGRYSEAIPMYQRSIELLDGDDDKALSWNRLGTAYKHLNEHDKTVEAYKMAEKYQPEGVSQSDPAPDLQADARINVDPVLQPILEQSTVITESAVEISQASQSEEQVSSGEEWLKNGSKQPAVMMEIPKQEVERQSVKISRQSVKIEERPGNAHIQNEIGNAYFNSGAFDQAIIAYNKAIELDSDFGKPYSNLALTYASQGRYAEAIPLFKQSIELPGSEEEIAISWNRLGDAYRRLGDSSSAIAAYQKADQLDPTCGESDSVLGEILEQLESMNPVDWNELGIVCSNTGAYDQAILALQKAIELDPEMGWPYSNLALAFTHQGKYTEAIPLYMKSIEMFDIDREKAISWNRLGDTYRRLNDRENAVKAYQKAVELDPENVTLLTRARFSLLSNCSAE